MQFEFCASVVCPALLFFAARVFLTDRANRYCCLTCAHCGYVFGHRLRSSFAQSEVVFLRASRIGHSGNRNFIGVILM